MDPSAGHRGLRWASSHRQPPWATRAIATTAMLVLVLVLVLVLLSTAAPTLALGPNQFERFMPGAEDDVRGVEQVGHDPGFGVPVPDNILNPDLQDFVWQPLPDSYWRGQQHHTPSQVPQDMANFGTYPTAGSLQTADNHYATNQHDGMSAGGVAAPSMVYQPYEHYEHGQAQSVPLDPSILGGSGVPAGPRSHARQSVASGSAQLRPQQKELGKDNAIPVSFRRRESGDVLQLWKLKEPEYVHVELAKGPVYVPLSSYQTSGGELFTDGSNRMLLSDHRDKYRAVSATKEEREAVLDIIDFRWRGDKGEHQRTTPYKQYQWQAWTASDYQPPEGNRAKKKYVQLKINFTDAVMRRGRPARPDSPISAFLVDDRLVLFSNQQHGSYYAAAFRLKVDERGLLMCESEKPERFAWVLGRFHEQRTVPSRPG